VSRRFFFLILDIDAAQQCRGLDDQLAAARSRTPAERQRHGMPSENDRDAERDKQHWAAMDLCVMVLGKKSISPAWNSGCQFTALLG